MTLIMRQMFNMRVKWDDYYNVGLLVSPRSEMAVQKVTVADLKELYTARDQYVILGWLNYIRGFQNQEMHSNMFFLVDQSVETDLLLKMQARLETAWLSMPPRHYEDDLWVAYNTLTGTTVVQSVTEPAYEWHAAGKQVVAICPPSRMLMRLIESLSITKIVAVSDFGAEVMTTVNQMYSTYQVHSYYHVALPGQIALGARTAIRSIEPSLSTYLIFRMSTVNTEMIELVTALSFETVGPAPSTFTTIAAALTHQFGRAGEQHPDLMVLAGERVYVAKEGSVGVGVIPLTEKVMSYVTIADLEDEMNVPSPALEIVGTRHCEYLPEYAIIEDCAMVEVNTSMDFIDINWAEDYSFSNNVPLALTIVVELCVRECVGDGDLARWMALGMNNILLKANAVVSSLADLPCELCGLSATGLVFPTTDQQRLVWRRINCPQGYLEDDGLISCKCSMGNSVVAPKDQFGTYHVKCSCTEMQCPTASDTCPSCLSLYERRVGRCGGCKSCEVIEHYCSNQGFPDANCICPRVPATMTDEIFLTYLGHWGFVAEAAIDVLYLAAPPSSLDPGETNQTWVIELDDDYDSDTS
jgi:hypothetical protein